MVLAGQKVVLREKRISDAENDYAWRCDTDLARLDAVLPLSMSYREYVGYYADELQHASRQRRRFAIDSLDDGKHIGNCMYYDIDDDRKQTELGIIIGDRGYWGKGYGSDAVTALVRHVFNDTGVDRIFLNTLEWNVRAQRCFQKCGFVVCGRATKRGNDFLVMELHRRWTDSIEADSAATLKGDDSKTSLPYVT
ncbi:MAG: GNAT family N-acetyltransferase [Dehalococcoidia bacterium]|nr:GNAT family N-acetyltransferase [Dehalococcoidia bacterium]